jgi:adenylyltransferase/sulfurtransferase
MSLSPDELLRYSRHLLLPEIGRAGQERLKAARVLIVGMGGVGSPAALYLAAAGVGTLGLLDHDAVDLTNLQRQVIHDTTALGRPKIDSAVERLRNLNPEIRLIPIRERLTSANALRHLAEFDLTIDGTDNFPTRYLVNDASVLLGKPLVYGSIFRFDGQVSVFGPPGPCYRCLFPDPPPPHLVPNCAEAGVLGVLPGIIGSLQALETIKLILGLGDSLRGRLVMFDALRLAFAEVQVRRNPDCAVCGDRPTVRALVDYEQFCGVPTAAARSVEITPDELVRALGALPPPVRIVDVREPWEWEIAHLPGSTLIPLDQLEQRLDELSPQEELVVLCHHGVRSLAAQQLLTEAGFRARSLAGGIDAWARLVDDTLARY